MSADPRTTLEVAWPLRFGRRGSTLHVRGGGLQAQESVDESTYPPIHRAPLVLGTSPHVSVDRWNVVLSAAPARFGGNGSPSGFRSVCSSVVVEVGPLACRGVGVLLGRHAVGDCQQTGRSQSRSDRTTGNERREREEEWGGLRSG
jgi:hypothetical protein